VRFHRQFVDDVQAVKPVASRQALELGPHLLFRQAIVVRAGLDLLDTDRHRLQRRTGPDRRVQFARRDAHEVRARRDVTLAVDQVRLDLVLGEAHGADGVSHV